MRSPFKAGLLGFGPESRTPAPSAEGIPCTGMACFMEYPQHIAGIAEGGVISLVVGGGEEMARAAPHYH